MSNMVPGQMNKKIVMAAGIYPPESGGPATFAYLHETNLRNLGYEVNVVPFSTVRMYPKIVRHLVYTLKLWRCAKRSDVVFALDPISVGIPARVVCSLRRVPLLLRLGGDYAWEQAKQRSNVTCNLDEFQTLKKRPILIQILRVLQTWVARSAVTVISPSEYLKSIIVSWGIPSERVEVVYSVSDVNTNTDKQIEIKEYNQSPLLFSVARLVPWKGFEVLMDVVAELRDSYPNIKLLIAGDGPYQAVLEEKIVAEQLHECVELLGRISHPEMKAISTQSDVFVLNTEYEGFSHVVYECMALRVPIITTRVGGNGELITDGISGLLVTYNSHEEIKEAITRLLEDTGLQERLTIGALQRIADFSPAISLERVVTIVESVIEQKV